MMHKVFLSNQNQVCNVSFVEWNNPIDTVVFQGVTATRNKNYESNEEWILRTISSGSTVIEVDHEGLPVQIPNIYFTINLKVTYDKIDFSHMYK